ncbi:hypothetical protein GSH52_001951 [Salmonella enterica]|nr:hypothetical protein [Salmonella enterica]
MSPERSIKTNAVFIILNDVIYSKEFELQEGGKRANPQELTKVSDWGEGTRPQHMQLEV